MNAKTILTALLIWTGLAAQAVSAEPIANSTPGVQGYDLVSYQTGKRPLRGNGHFLAEHDGVTYLFVNAENQAAFQENPARYVPAYGGYCAFGVSVGKKFVGDPEVWRLVDGRLYLNLDTSIQDQWLKDVPGRIRKAEANWRTIRNTAPSEL